jgi:hypothetical protein
MHIFDLHPDASGLTADTRRLTRLGTEVHIRDVGIPTDGNGNARAIEISGGRARHLP